MRFQNLVVALLIPFCLRAQGQDPGLDLSINNTILLSVAPSLKHAWTLELVSGQGAGDRITLLPTGSPKKPELLLTKAGDTCALQAGGEWEVTFAPNFGKDGASYLVRLTDSDGTRRGGAFKQKQYVTFRADKPVDTILSLRNRRKLTLAPDWGAPLSLRGALGMERQEAIGRSFQKGRWTISEAQF